MNVFFKFGLLAITLLPLTTLADERLFDQANSAFAQQHYQAAFSDFNKAAISGHVKSQYNLAYLYQQGVGTKKNLQKAIDWYKKAASQKHVKAMYNLGYLYQHTSPPTQNYVDALKWYKKAAALGSDSALVNIGQLYFFGLGVDKNYTEAYAWYTLASARGNKNGLRNKDLVAVKLTPFELASGDNLYRHRKKLYVNPF